MCWSLSEGGWWPLCRALGGIGHHLLFPRHFFGAVTALAFQTEGAARRVGEIVARFERYPLESGHFHLGPSLRTSHLRPLSGAGSAERGVQDCEFDTSARQADRQ